jgi:hypothetical protein
MKMRVSAVLIGLLASVSFAGYSDGWITAGEYEYGVIWTTYNPPLIIAGGGADVIDVVNGRLEVRSTSIPINGDFDTGGIWDIALFGSSHLDYLLGITDLLTIDGYATADLYGGRIDAINSMQYIGWRYGRWYGDPHIDIYAQPGWSWIYSGQQEKIGITGLWQDNTPFSIELINDPDYDPTWMNINVIVPEPATLCLISLGGLLIRKRPSRKPVLSGKAAAVKRMIPLGAVCLCLSTTWADYSDGWITAGEYEYGVRWTSYNPPLIVDGGGVDVIEMRDFSRLEVRSTSVPVNGDFDTGGIWDIVLDDYSQVLYLDGITEEITISENAKAVLKGGRIDAITSRQYVGWRFGRWYGDPHINIYALPGWSWVENGGQKIGITGFWQDNTPFSIELFGYADYDPAWMNINVIVPEPMTVMLIALGGLLMRKR